MTFLSGICPIALEITLFGIIDDVLWTYDYIITRNNLSPPPFSITSPIVRACIWQLFSINWRNAKLSPLGSWPTGKPEMSLSFKFLSTSVVTLCKSVGKLWNPNHAVGQLNWYTRDRQVILLRESVRFNWGRNLYRWYPFITEFFSGMEGFLKKNTQFVKKIIATI